MRREELWSELVNKHPSFGREGQVTLGAAGLRRLFDLTWNKAEDHGFEVGRYASRSTEGIPEFFKEVFTKKR